LRPFVEFRADRPHVFAISLAGVRPSKNSIIGEESRHLRIPEWCSESEAGVLFGFMPESCSDRIPVRNGFVPLSANLSPFLASRGVSPAVFVGHRAVLTPQVFAPGTELQGLRRELGGDVENGMDELTLTDWITFRHPPDLAFSDGMHRLVTLDRSTASLHRTESEARRDRFLMNR